MWQKVNINTKQNDVFASMISLNFFLVAEPVVERPIDPRMARVGATAADTDLRLQFPVPVPVPAPMPVMPPIQNQHFSPQPDL